MNQTDRFEPRLRERLADLGVGSDPRNLDDILRRTAVTRQRPAWTFPGRWLPMLSIASDRDVARPMVWRMAWLLIIAMLATVLTAGGLAIVGSPNPFTTAPGPLRAVAQLPTACPAGTLASGTIATIAGTGKPPGLSGNGDGGPAVDAGLNTSLGSIAVAADGSLYLVANGSPDIRRVTPDGTIEHVRGPSTGAPFEDLWGVAIDGASDMYVTDNGSNRVWKVDLEGTIVRFVGSGEAGHTGDGGPALEATIVADNIGVSPDGDIYLNDMNRYRVVDEDGVIRAFAGTGEEGFSGDGGPALDATFGEVIGVTTDAVGNVYLADTGNQRIRKVDHEGIITTVAGSGERGYSGDGGPATEAALNDPVMLAVADDGTLYFSEHHNNVVRRVSPDGIITTVAGTGVAGYDGDCGPASEAMLDQPWGIALHDDVLYIVDMGNRRIRIVVP
jgi:sugar lactone lactonase YvrE